MAKTAPFDPSQTTSKWNGKSNQSPEASTVTRSTNGNGATMPDTEFSEIPERESGDLPGGQHSTVDLSQNASNGDTDQVRPQNAHTTARTTNLPLPKEMFQTNQYDELRRVAKT